jgi:uncharacterized protein (DUF433 family)
MFTASTNPTVVAAWPTQNTNIHLMRSARGAAISCVRQPAPVRGIIRRPRLELLMPNQRVVHSDPDILGGVPVFVGTRVPVKTLFDYLEAGDALDEFLNDFPSVTREQAVAALELGRAMIETHAAAA